MVMSYESCPGVRTLVGPGQIVMRTCPACGEEVEFFSDDTETECPSCGKTLHQEATPSCVVWCEYAEKCIGDLKDRGMIPPSRVEELERIAKKQS
jgi:predicted RNA-binding Zn-ribbon protein involved in translation (DUF1610 family)